jgi:hypothetical protein
MSIHLYDEGRTGTRQAHDHKNQEPDNQPEHKRSPDSTSNVISAEDPHSEF